MRHRRFWAVAAALMALTLVASACKKKPTPIDDGKKTDEPPAFTTVTDGVLSVGSCLDYAPFESIEGGDEVGFDVDLAEEIATRLGLTVE